LQAALLWWVWLSVAIFLLACAWRALRYIRTPEHLRWDLYPVAHEPARDHGGSYLEEKDWWDKPRKKSHFGEISVLFQEIVLLKGVYENNLRVWWGSLPFHWGLYLLMLVSVGLLLPAFGLGGEPVMTALKVGGLIGGGLLALGAAILLVLRMTDPKLLPYTAPVDRLNLALLTALGALCVAVAASAGGMAAPASAIGSMLRFRAPEVGALLAAQMIVGGLFILYLPFTRMVHFFAKYFTYHKVRWDDRPVEPGTPLERKLAAALNYGVSWSAEHVRTGKTWAEVATNVPEADK
jgi:nitrate reductase gamma subunit